MVDSDTRPTYSRAWVSASSRVARASVSASARISRASSSAWRWISAALVSAASTIARTCSLAADASVSERRRDERFRSSISSASACRCWSTASGS